MSLTKMSLPDCDSEIYSKGTVVCSLMGPASEAIEAWVKKVQVEAGVLVDWHRVAGRATIRTLPENVGQVVRALNKVAPLEGEVSYHTGYWKPGSSRLFTALEDTYRSFLTKAALELRQSSKEGRELSEEILNLLDEAP